MGFLPTQESFSIAAARSFGRRQGHAGQPAAAAAQNQVSSDDRKCSGCGCDLVRAVLGELALRWPVAMDLNPAAVGLDDARHQEFVRLMQALLDQGFVTYEAADKRAGVPRFHNALITPSGRSALKVMRFLATLP